MNAHSGVPDEPRSALVCIDDEGRRTSVCASLEELGYQAQVPEDADTAIEMMRKTAFQVVVLDELYQAATAADNAVMRALDTMPIAGRRYVFVTLIGDDVKTLDHATAFSRSVNAVVNLSDVGGLAPVLRRAIADNDAFYRVYRDVLQAAGKR